MTDILLISEGLSQSWTLWVQRLVIIDSVFHLSSEVLYKPLNWPSSSIAQSTNGVSFNLPCKLLEHVYLGEVGVSNLDSLKDVNHPAGSLSARSALAATLVLVEFGQPQYGVDDIS